MRKKIQLLLAAPLAAAMLQMVTPVQAQVLYGTLVGRITDPAGRPVAGAVAVATEAQTGTEYKQQTSDSGEFDLRNLLPGTYTLEITATGFGVSRVTGIAVTANQIARADQPLGVASAAETVNVSATTSALQTDSGTIHGTLTSEALENLPIGGFNNYQSLISLLPGATPSRYQNSVMDTPSRSLTTNINGSSRNGNVTSVDGAAIQQVYLPHHTLYNPPTEDIQSVDIVTNSFTAEQGLAGGAVVSVLTKSGTNNFHGTLWEEHTNSAMAARNYFYNKTYFAYAGNQPPKNILNQFGANLGGPILHNRLFFFTGFEGLSQRQLYPELISLPTDAERNGDFTGLATIYDPLTGTSTGTGRRSFASENADGRNAIETGINPAAAKLLALIPHANLSGTANNYSVAGTYSLDRFSFDEKVNYQINPKSSMFGKLSYLRADVFSPSTLGVGGGTGLSPGGSNAGSGYSQTRVFVAGVGFTRTFTDHLLFDANFGVGHNGLTWYESDFARNLGPTLGIPGTNSDGDGSYGTDPNQAGLPSFAVTGFETFGNPDAYTPELKDDLTFTYVGNLTWATGSHTMRFGTQLLNNRLNQYQPQRGFGPRGGFTFTGGVTGLNGGSSPSSANSFAQFLLGLPDSMGKSYQYENPMTGNEWQYGLYAQDQWQATSNLTLTYGVRWEYYPIMSRQGGLGMQRYDLNTNQVILGGVDGQPNGAGSSASKLQFAPRLGLAYRLGDKTVLRAGYGISIDPYPFTRAMRDPYPVTIAQTVNAGNSYVAAGTFTTGIPGYSTVAPTINSDGTATLPTSAYTKTLPAGTYRRGYVESLNASVQQQLPAGFDLTASYVNTQTIRQTAYFEVNAGQTPGLGAAGQPLYTKFGRAAETQEILPFGTATYNGLQVNLKRPFQNGVLMIASYTFAKSLDNTTDDDSVPLFNAVAYLARNHAVSDFDRRQVFDLAVSAGLPFGRGHALLHSGVVGAIAGGWNLNAVLSKYTGLPFTPTASATSLNAPNNTQVANKVKSNVATLHGIGKYASWFDTSAFAPVATANFGSASRNSLRGPGNTDLDLGISRSFTILRETSFELRGEAFNLTNTPNFANPASNVSVSSFGQITSTAGSAADQRTLRFTGKLHF